MKIATITVQNAYNFGAMLQTYALHEKLKSMGHECEIVNYMSDSIKSHYGIYKESDSVIFNIKQTGKNIVKKIIKRKQYKRFDDFKDNYMTLTNPVLSKTDLIKLNKKFEGFICGSDQIWNPDIMSKRDFYAFFLQFVSDKNKKISYAPSFGMENLSSDFLNSIKGDIDSFTNVSCRETSGVNMLKSITNKEIEQVLDPTLLITKQEWTELSKGSQFNTDDKYMLIYQLDFNKEMVEKSVEYAHKNGMKAILLSASAKKNNMVDYVIKNAGPLEFLYAFCNASAIATNSFHGTVFSMLFEKQFIVFAHKTRNTRMESILNIVGLSDRIYSNNNAIDILNKEIDYKKVTSKLNIEIDKSIKFIEKSIA